ncbi:tagaturonate reductase [Cohnella zeiphila]|uniref:Tagaturonate reductase n=1 Tax=Cohnella zeiphila TaxID=2761120 RepID=A0A7X0SKE3_9BACL|nr:tagaturonate reductase [Cohnella zeiphila]MBB6731630.1 tagaturonate reductase [Cohnella zeiphila]
MTRLNKDALKAAERRSYEAAARDPVTVLQIGEGNFLRGFFDWMIQECRKEGLFDGSVAVVQPRPSGKPKIDALAAQDGLYTLVTRGLENGRPVERTEIVSVFAEAFDPYSEWDRFGRMAERPELRFVVSNTTEAGLAYKPEELKEGEPIQSFPGKAAWLLYRRYLALGGMEAPGLIFLPCELLEGNGDELKRCVLRYCDDWALPEDFRRWVEKSNRFLNSLVDRIVTGYAADRADEWFREWGYEDPLLNTAEPYHLWAIEAEPELDAELPLQRAGLNVHWTRDLRPYQQRKVRILNGAHTLMTPIALLHGITYVREAMEHPRFGPFVREGVEQEIVPAVPLPADELLAYAGTVYDRFLNPYLNHRLSDIAMNSLSKFKVRVLPSLLHYADNGLPLPERLVLSLAGLLRYYKAERTEDGYAGATLAGDRYLVRDDAALLEKISAIWAAGQTTEASVGKLLALKDIWGTDLSAVGGLAARVAEQIREMEEAAK